MINLQNITSNIISISFHRLCVLNHCQQFARVCLSIYLSVNGQLLYSTYIFVPEGRILMKLGRYVGNMVRWLVSKFHGYWLLFKADKVRLILVKKVFDCIEYFHAIGKWMLQKQREDRLSLATANLLLSIKLTCLRLTLTVVSFF